MRLKQSHGIRIYGLLWFAAGLMLMAKGMPFLVKASVRGELPLISFLKPLAGTSEQSAMVLVVAALVLGLLKGRFVLARAANKMILRLSSLPDPVPLKQVFNLRYCLIIALMISFGVSLRFLHVPLDVHGLIDLAIGSALINGSMTYFRNKPQLSKAIEE